MHITISELFRYRQYKFFPVAYCFDRKTYSIQDATLLSMPKTETYERLIPLFQIDQDNIQNAFIQTLNNKPLMNKYNTRNVCFEEFVQLNNLWKQWWDYYRKTVSEIAIEWCQKNKIKYINDISLN